MFLINSIHYYELINQTEFPVESHLKLYNEQLVTVV